MRTQLTSPVADVAAQAVALKSAPKPNPSSTLQVEKTRSHAKLSTDKALQTLAPSVAVAVSIDQDRNTVYRFLDQRTGVLIRQVPPEEVLRVVRNIHRMLQASEQKVKVVA